MNNEAILLRKLSFRSKLAFGRYSDLSVQDVMSIDHQYLLYAYYECSNISFADEVLNELKIIDSLRIDKPGTKKFWRADYFKHFKTTMSEDDYMHYNSHRVKVIRTRRLNKTLTRRPSYKKSVLQSKNHGK